MWSAHVTLLVVLIAAGSSRAELPKSTPVCSKDWGGWWDAYHCGTFPMHWWVATGNMIKVKELLDAGYDINQKDERQWTPIVEAAFFGKQDVSVELIRRGADMSSMGYRALNIVKVAKMKWCVGHSQVNTCPTTLYNYDRTIEVLFRGCEWTECHEGFHCVGRQCWPDKCNNVECGTNAACLVENRKPVCRCNAGFKGEDPTDNCQAISSDSKTGLKTGNLVLDPCPEDYYIFGSQCLYIDDQKPVSWGGAIRQCKRKKGVLAKIENPQNFRSYMDEFYPSMAFWLGGNDKKKEGVWRWQSGEILGSGFPWGKNNGGKQQPNNGHNNEHCMSLKYFNPNLKTQYVDNRCNIKQHYVCEAPRNYVDELALVSNSIHSIIENNSGNNDNNHNNRNDNNIANEIQREINNNTGEISNDSSDMNDINQNSNSTRNGNDNVMDESEISNGISVTSDIDEYINNTTNINNINKNINDTDEIEISNNISITSDVDENINSTIDNNNIDENNNSTVDSEISNDITVTTEFNQNNNSTRNINNINNILSDTSNH